MRFLLAGHLIMLRSQDAPKETLDELERLLTRYGGDPANIEGHFRRSGSADGSSGTSDDSP